LLTFINKILFRLNFVNSQMKVLFSKVYTHTMKQMCAASADDNGFVMSYDEAYNLVKETYSDSIQAI